MAAKQWADELSKINDQSDEIIKELEDRLQRISHFD
jgi:hypothetical protein